MQKRSTSSPSTFDVKTVDKKPKKERVQWCSMSGDRKSVSGWWESLTDGTAKLGKREPRPKKFSPSPSPPSTRVRSSSVRRVTFDDRRDPGAHSEYFAYRVSGTTTFVPLNDLIAAHGAGDVVHAVTLYDGVHGVSWVVREVRILEGAGESLSARLSFVGYPSEFDDDTLVQEADRRFYIGLDEAIVCFQQNHRELPAAKQRRSGKGTGRSESQAPQPLHSSPPSPPPLISPAASAPMPAPALAAVIGSAASQGKLSSILRVACVVDLRY